MTAQHISLERASVRFGTVHALHEATATLRPGAVTGIVGGDGAGKTTLLQLLAGRVALSSGRVTGIPRDRRSIGYQPADAGVWRNLSVAENIDFVTRVYGVAPARGRARADELLDRAGLTDVRSRLAGRLSGGMRQKLGVVLATLHRPQLVLLDEPTTGVDPISRAELWTLIAGSAAEGATVAFATTYLDEAERAAQLLLMNAGQVLAAGTPSEVTRATPGSIWQTPAASAALLATTAASPAGTAVTQYSWRRGNTVYFWTPPGTDPSTVPRGCAPAPDDLENATIAQLLSAERSTAGSATAAPTGSAGTGLLERTGQPRVPAGGFGVEAGARDRERAPGTLLSAVGVGRSYGTFAALEGVSLSLAAGEVVGLLGGNGAGKTTLMRILLGIDVPSTGTTTLHGGPPTLAARRRLGYVSQGLGLYPDLSAAENLAFAAAVHRVPLPEGAHAAARAFGPGPVSGLSLGAQRLLAYRAATVHDPELLVLDEPTSGMDGLSRARLWRELRAAADRCIGVLVTTHYMREAAQCDRLVILSSGRVADAGTEAQITGAHSSLSIDCEAWERAFTLLREAGLPVVLHGRTLRVPGTALEEVAAALAPLDGAYSAVSGAASLEEAMLLGARDAV